MTKTRIVFLHGFLGQGSDWGRIAKAVRESLPECELITPSLFHPTSPQLLPFSDWPQDFVIRHSLTLGSTRNILVGYSLGGRLGLHLLAAYPDLFHEALLISTHPGTVATPERLDWERGWAHRLIFENWETVLEDWNAQDLFSNSPAVFRSHEDFCRQKLSLSLTLWSNTKHRFQLAQIKTPLTWMVGAQDNKYAEFFNKLEPETLPGQLLMMKDLGHRIPWEAPSSVSDHLT